MNAWVLPRLFKRFAEPAGAADVGPSAPYGRSNAPVRYMDWPADH